jgi:mRNA interferase RelE/StbE
MYKVVVLPKAEKTFARADAPLARKLTKAFELLEIDPLRHPNIKPLTGPLKGFFRFRTGDYRIVYRIGAAEEIVYVVRIAHRKEAYER